LRVVSTGAHGVPPVVLVPTSQPPDEPADTQDPTIDETLRKSCVVVALLATAVDGWMVSLMVLPDWLSPVMVKLGEPAEALKIEMRRAVSSTAQLKVTIPDEVMVPTLVDDAAARTFVTTVVGQPMSFSP
jgi:hypothetical protein